MRHISLVSRVRRLRAQLPVVTELPDVPREWRDLSARDPKALEHARALSARIRHLWPDRKPSDEECWADETCAHHILVLEATRAGGLANLMAPFLDEDDA